MSGESSPDQSDLDVVQIGPVQTIRGEREVEGSSSVGDGSRKSSWGGSVSVKVRRVEDFGSVFSLVKVYYLIEGAEVRKRKN